MSFSIPLPQSSLKIAMFLHELMTPRFTSVLGPSFLDVGAPTKEHHDDHPDKHPVEERDHETDPTSNHDDHEGSEPAVAPVGGDRLHGAS